MFVQNFHCGYDKFVWRLMLVGGNLNNRLCNMISGSNGLLPNCKYAIYLVILGLSQIPTMAQSHGLVFVDLIGLDRIGQENSPELKHIELLTRATLFYSRDFDKTKVLAEFIANNKQSHFGRVKIGWKPDPSNLIWFGRDHNPASFWRDLFHHGGWLQPTISRPSIAEFEVPGGILPSHSTGLSYEAGGLVNNNAGFSSVASLGYTSVIDSGGLQVPELVDASRGTHSSSTAFRLSYRFEPFTGGNEVGILGSYNHILSDLSKPKEIEQDVVGLFVNWNFSDLRITSEFTIVRNKIIDSGTAITSNENFLNAYILADYNLVNDWNMFARWEDTNNEQSSQYLRSFPKFIIKRNLLGVRYSITRNQIFKFEMSDNQLFTGTQYRQLAVQWSYVYP